MCHCGLSLCVYGRVTGGIRWFSGRFPTEVVRKIPGP